MSDPPRKLPKGRVPQRPNLYDMVPKSPPRSTKTKNYSRSKRFSNKEPTEDLSGNISTMFGMEEYIASNPTQTQDSGSIATKIHNKTEPISIPSASRASFKSEPTLMSSSPKTQTKPESSWWSWISKIQDRNEPSPPVSTHSSRDQTRGKMAASMDSRTLTQESKGLLSKGFDHKAQDVSNVSTMTIDKHAVSTLAYGVSDMSGPSLSLAVKTARTTVQKPRVVLSKMPYSYRGMNLAQETSPSICERSEDPNEKSSENSTLPEEEQREDKESQ